MIPLDHLPEIGERILVQFDSRGKVEQPIPATVISMAECRRLQPDLWRNAYGKEHGGPEGDAYGPDDTIRAWKYDEPANGREASFCIMRFGGAPNFTYNKFVFTPAALPTLVNYEDRMAVIGDDGPMP